jgi:hypothetical protein
LDLWVDLVGDGDLTTLGDINDSDHIVMHNGSVDGILNSRGLNVDDVLDVASEVSTSLNVGPVSLQVISEEETTNETSVSKLGVIRLEGLTASSGTSHRLSEEGLGVGLDLGDGIDGTGRGETETTSDDVDVGSVVVLGGVIEKGVGTDLGKGARDVRDTLQRATTPREGHLLDSLVEGEDLGLVGVGRDEELATRLHNSVAELGINRLVELDNATRVADIRNGQRSDRGRSGSETLEHIIHVVLEDDIDDDTLTHKGKRKEEAVALVMATRGKVEKTHQWDGGRESPGSSSILGEDSHIGSSSRAVRSTNKTSLVGRETSLSKLTANNVGRDKVVNPMLDNSRKIVNILENGS